MKHQECIDNYRDLPYGKYEEIMRLCEEGMNEVDRKVAILAILTGKTEDEILHLPLPTFTAYSAKSRFLEHECPENLIPAVRRTYALGGFVLVPVTDIRKITAAQYIDFQTFSKDKEKRMVEMLSCFLVPRGMDYNEGYDVLEVHDAIRNEMSVAELLALVAFFFGRFLKSTRNTLTYSIRLLKKKDPQKATEVATMYRNLVDSLTDGVGLRM